MKIEVDYDNLKNMLAGLINSIGCHECPYYDKCEGAEDDLECAELFIDELAKK